MNMFSYNCKTGNIMQFDKRVVRWEKCGDELRIFTKYKGVKWYLSALEMEDFRKCVKWLIEQHGCDFGPDINALAV